MALQAKDAENASFRRTLGRVAGETEALKAKDAELAENKAELEAKDARLAALEEEIKRLREGAAGGDGKADDVRSPSGVGGAGINAARALR